MGAPALMPPVRCARCRSPLWNRPRVNKQPKRDRDRQAHELTLDRDGYERLYRSEKNRREQLEAQVSQLLQGVKADAELIGKLDRENILLARQVARLEKKLLEKNGQKRLIK